MADSWDLPEGQTQSVPMQVIRCFDYAEHLASLRLPYHFGGGHPGFGPSGHPPGYDCSSWVSAILNAGGILNSRVALDTEELASWGLPGRGRYLTVFTINTQESHHCLIEFTLPGHSAKQFSMAAHTGTICGWWDLPSNFTDGYTARRRP